MISSNPRLRASGRIWQFIAVSSALSAVIWAQPGQAIAVGSAAPVTTRVSVSGTGTQANGNSTPPAITPDGRYVAFSSVGSNLVPGDTNGSEDVFLRDRQTGSTSRVSVSGLGAQAICCYGATNARPVVSADGRYVAFTSTAHNLVPNDTNNMIDVFLRDRQAGITRRISVTSNGAQTFAGGDIYPSGIAANGRYVTFWAFANDLVPGDTNFSPDVFLRDVQAGTTRRISVTSTGAQAKGYSSESSITPDGRFVAFESNATNLVPGDTNNRIDVFRRDLLTGATLRISVSGTGAQGNNDSADPAISADGRYVTFFANATNLVPTDTNNRIDVFLHDLQSGVTRRISVSGAGAQSNQDSRHPDISADGRYVSFDSDASNLVPGDTNAVTDVFVRDWQSGITRRASVSGTGLQGNNQSDSPAISAGGLHVAFRSYATNLVPADTNGSPDVFVRVT